MYAQHEDQRQVIFTLRTALREANDAIHTLQRDGPSSPSRPLTTSAVQCQTILQGLPSCDSATQTTRRELNDLMGSMAITPEPEVSAPPTRMEEPSGDVTHTDEPSGVITPSTHESDRNLMPPPQSTSVSWADSSEREALDPPAYIPTTDQLPLPSDLEAPQAQATGASSSSSSDISNGPAPPRVHAQRTRSPDIGNNYNWFPASKSVLYEAKVLGEALGLIPRRLYVPEDGYGEHSLWKF